MTLQLWQNALMLSTLKTTFTFCLLLSLNVWGAGPSVGAPAPLVEAKVLDSDRTIRVAPPLGKVVIINFWATWCGPCKSEMPLIQSYYDKHKSQGLEVLAINMDDVHELAEIRQFAKRYSFPIALKADTNFKGLGRIWRLPTTFVIDRNGILRKDGQVGEAEISQAELDAVVTPLLAKP